MRGVPGGATNKRIYYLLSGVVRLLSFIVFLVAAIVVGIVVRPVIMWLNILLVALSIGSLISAVYNIALCGMTAHSYRNNILVQVIGMILTAVSGGIVSTTFTAIALGTRVTEDDLELEGIVRVRKYGKKI